MTTFGRKAAELVKEMATTDDASLPAYNEHLLREVKAETQEHYQALLAAVGQALSNGRDAADVAPEDAAAIAVHNRALLRNKRLMLAYIHARMERIKALRWTVGGGLPADLSAALSPAERDFFSAYNRLLGAYMGRGGVGLNLTLDPSPPKSQKVEVRCLRDYGTVFTRDGELTLRAGSGHYMWRDEAQPLIAEGVLAKVSDE